MNYLEPIFDDNGYAHYIYKLTFIPDRRFYYLGKHSTKDLKDGYGGRGALVLRWKKRYGSKCFEKEIISYWPSKKEVLEEEFRIIGDLWTADPFCLNQCPGGENNGTIDNTGLIWINDGNQQKLIKPEFLEVYEKVGWKKGTSVVARQKSSRSQKGRALTKEHCKALSLAKIGTKHSEETKLKMSLAAKGKPKSESARKNMQKAQQQLSEYHRQFCQNSAWVKKENFCKKIQKEELDYYLSQGWEKGRILKKKNAILPKN